MQWPKAETPSSAAPSEVSAAAPTEAPKSPRDEFQSILNMWAHVVPVRLIEMLEDFALKHLGPKKPQPQTTWKPAGPLHVSTATATPIQHQP